MAHHRSDPRKVLLRDFIIFQMKLLLDSLKDMALVTLATIATAVDLVRGRHEEPRLFYQVVRMSEKWDLWLNLNEAAENAEATPDGFFGASLAGADSLLGKLEMAVRGGDVPRGSQATEAAA
ncbi:MAG TPA: hypothetical protein VK837_06225 [Longimicrobiales bacterium]|nr:hypothetical protein [Longimicrobiales bacterium]